MLARILFFLLISLNCAFAQGTYPSPTFNDLNVTGSSTIPFTQSGTGAVSTTVDAKLKNLSDVYVADFGPANTCNGATDDTNAIQSAITVAQTARSNAAGATGRRVILPQGICKISSTIILSFGTSLLGQGVFASKLEPISSMVSMVKISRRGAVVENIEFKNTSGQATNAIEIDKDTDTFASYVRHNFISGTFTNAILHSGGDMAFISDNIVWSSGTSINIASADSNTGNYISNNTLSGGIGI